MPQGGLRPNAGRKKANHTIAAEAARKTVIEAVVAQLMPLLEAKFALALGHLKEGTDALGNTRIYTISPDGNAIQYLLNQAIGKPTENLELSGKDGGPIAVQGVEISVRR